MPDKYAEVLKSTGDDDDVLVYIDPRKRALVTVALLVGFFGIHFYMRAFSMCTAYIMADWNAGEYYSAGKALQTAVMVLATSVSARLIPKWGIKKIMGGSLIIVILCNFGTLMANSLPMFLIMVMLQGIGNAGLVSNMISLMNKIWPPSKRAMWLSSIGITQGIAAIVIPTLAGLLIDRWGWESVYYLMTVIQGVGLVLTLTLTPSNTQQRNYIPRKFDTFGTLIFLIWICCIVLACNFGNSWGWGSPKILTLLVIGLGGLAAFIVVEAKLGSDAIFPVRLFNDNRNVAFIFIQSFFACAACMGQFVFVIYYMQVVMGTTAAVSALPFTVFSIGTLVMSPIYGMLYQKWGKSKGLLAICTLLVALNAFCYGIILSPTASLGLIFFISAFGGLGHCCVVTLCYNAADEYLPKSRIADGNAVAYIAICVAGSVGLAVMQAISNAVAASKVAAGMEDLAARASGYETAMLAAGICGLLGVAATLLLDRKIKNNGAL